MSFPSRFSAQHPDMRSQSISCLVFGLAFLYGDAVAQAPPAKAQIAFTVFPSVARKGQAVNLQWTDGDSSVSSP